MKQCGLRKQLRYLLDECGIMSGPTFKKDYYNFLDLAIEKYNKPHALTLKEFHRRQSPGVQRIIHLLKEKNKYQDFLNLIRRNPASQRMQNVIESYGLNEYNA